jgi:hypothetical protein
LAVYGDLVVPWRRQGWFGGDWQELKAADGSGLGLANMAERLIAI